MRRLGKFEILDRLGAGGMGVVYRARDVELGRQVALKVLPDEYQSDGSRRARFLNEARAAAALNHPAIATLYEFGEAESDDGDRRLFLAMELVEGEDLRTQLAAGPVPPVEALRMGRQLASGLDAAHRRGIIHRDLKPANVRITPDGQVKILDFGLAKLAGPSTPDLPHEPGVTREGVPMGTPPYLAPEQMRGEAVDARADLFSLGVLLFEMVTRRRPFEGSRFTDYVVAVQRGPAPPLRSQLPDIDPRFAAIVDRLVHRSPSSRFATAHEVEEQLARIALASQTLTSAETSPAFEPVAEPAARHGVSRKRLVLAVGVLLVVVAIGWTVTRSVRDRTPAPASSGLRLAVAQFENLSGDSSLDFAGRGLAAALSSDLSSLAEIAVIAPAMTAAYSGLADRYSRLAREQDVDAVLEGRVQSERGQVRVAVDYVDARRGSLDWSLTFEGTSDALLGLQSAVAAGVGSKLRAVLSAASLDRLERSPTASNEAFESYLRGLRFLEQYSSQSDLEVAIRFFERAIEHDSKFASAHAQLATALITHAQRSHDVERLDRGIREARSALELDAGSVAAKLALARGYRDTGRFVEARVLLQEVESSHPRRGSTSDGVPSQVELLIEKSESQHLAGARQEATETLLEATRLEPTSWQAWHALGVDSIRSGSWDEAHAQLERARELAPEQVRPVSNLVAVELFTGDLEGAVEIVESFHGPVTDASLASNAGTAYFGLGRFDLAEEYYRLARQLRPTDEVVCGNLGDVLLELGRVEDARREYGAALALVEDRSQVFPELPANEASRVFFLAKAGRCADAVAADAARRFADSDRRDLVRLTKAAALCDRETEALDYLRRALDAGAAPGELRTADELASIRDSASFRRLVGGP